MTDAITDAMRLLLAMRSRSVARDIALAANRLQHGAARAHLTSAARTLFDIIVALDPTEPPTIEGTPVEPRAYFDGKAIFRRRRTDP